MHFVDIYNTNILFVDITQKKQDKFMEVTDFLSYEGQS